MNKIPSFAGTFYPDNPDELSRLLSSCMQKQKNEIKSQAIIVPHAGIYYSGHCAMSAYQHLELNENIFIIAPSHHHQFNNIAFPSIHILILRLEA